MRSPRTVSRRFAAAVLLALTLHVRAMAAASGLELIAAEYVPDEPFAQFLHLWQESWARRGDGGELLPATHPPLGGYVHVYCRNPAAQPLEIQDLLLDGVSLAEAIAFSADQASGLHPASIRFSKLPEAQIRALIAAGRPMWWMADPQPVPPGGHARVTVRLRRPPASTLRIQLKTAQGWLEASIAPTAPGAHFLSISFPAPDQVCAYVRSASAAGPPTRILLDGRDVTGRSTIATDPALGIAVVTIRLDSPLERGSFHLFEARYADDRTARAALRAATDELVYGMWGYPVKGDTREQRVQTFLADLRVHHINTLMHSYGGDVTEFLLSRPGAAYAARAGLRAMTHSPGDVREPLYFFLLDEPDAHDYAVNRLPPDERLGTLAQALVERSREFRARGPAVPQLLNVDATYKPENWYTYAQLPDVYCSDPYYQAELQGIYSSRPAWAGSFLKPTAIYGTAVVCRSACAPRPLHIVLNAVRHDTKDAPFRFATPAEKRLEVFYALAGGATGLSYWWFTPLGEYYGCGGSGPEAVALWREIGLLGGEVRTVGALLTRSCPAALAVKAPGRFWVRTLLAGSDTVLVLLTNDNVASDRLGTVVVPADKTSVSVTLPSWLEPADAFEVSVRGVQPVSWRMSSGLVALELGRTELTRLIVLTSDAQLRDRLASTYQSQFAENVKALLAITAGK